jgi:hypothetical protein
MDTLMRTLKLLAVGVLLVVSTALPANAQAPDAPAQPAAPQEQPAQTPPVQTPPVETPPVETPAAQTPTAQTTPDDDDEESRFFFSVNMGGQNKEQSFSDSSTFSIYNESGALATAHSIGGGTLFDVGAGVRLWKGLGVGIAYSTVKNFNPASASVRVPHPVIFGQSRTAEATVEDLEHSQNAVHLQLMWMVPLTRKFHLTAMVGPTFFTVRQTVATVAAPQDIVDPAPFNNLSIRTVSLTDVKDSPVGFNIGADATYLIVSIKGIGIGVGGFVRFSSASLDLPTEATGDAKLKAGGPQGGAGLRLRF